MRPVDQGCMLPTVVGSESWSNTNIPFLISLHFSPQLPGAAPPKTNNPKNQGPSKVKAWGPTPGGSNGHLRCKENNFSLNLSRPIEWIATCPIMQLKSLG